MEYATIYVTVFIKIGHGIPKLTVRGGIYRQDARDCKRVLLFLRKKKGGEIMLKAKQLMDDV
jgi:hypothetical protein